MTVALREFPSNDLIEPDGVLLVARVDGRPSGCVGLRLLPDDVGEVTRLFVVNAARRAGLGLRLTRALEAAARDRGLNMLRLDTRADLVEARRLYARLGYREVAPFNAGQYAEHWFEKTLVKPERRASTFPPRRRRMLIGAAAGFALAGVTAAGVALLANGSGSADSAWDQHVLRAAEIALPKPAPNTIVHVSVTQTMTRGARGDSALLVPTVDGEGWLQQGAPWRLVTREQVPGQTPTWQTASRVYDPATKRVYVDPPFPSSHPRYTLTKRGRDGVITLRIATSYGPVRETVSTAQARGLRTGAAGIQWVAGLNASPRFLLGATVVSKAEPANASLAEQPISTSLNFPAQLHRLLQSGHARVAGPVTVDGRTAIKIAISGVSGYQRMTY